jgi:hypothetical protein
MDGHPEEPPPTSSEAASFEPLALPPDFTQRIRKLPCNTLLHIPISCRLRSLNIMENCLQGMCEGSSSHALAEEGRSKLLFGAVPQGVPAADEVAARLRLWEGRRFEQLLQKTEQQVIMAQRLRSRTSASASSLVDLSRKCKKAIRVAAEGAYRKATNGLVSAMMSFSADEDFKWAGELLPRSSSPCAFSDRVHVL